jgi:hypothetical protein
MERFTQAAKILIDRVFLSVSKELRELKKDTETPRVKYKSKTQWRSVCEESMDMLAHGLANYIDENLLQETNIEEMGNEHLRGMGGIPMVLPRFELEIDTQLRACLEQITQNKPWSARRAKEISLGIGTSLASFGGGVGLLPGEHREKSHSITNYVMTFIMFALKTSSPSGESVDAIPMVPCDCCGKDMPLYWKSKDLETQCWTWRALDICDNCGEQYW